MSTVAGRIPRRLRYVDSVFVYRCRMSHFSSWKSHGLTMRRSPSRIHIRFFSFPGILRRRDFPSAHITRIREAPRSWSATPKISPARVDGRRTRTTSSWGTGGPSPGVVLAFRVADGTIPCRPLRGPRVRRRIPAGELDEEPREQGGPQHHHHREGEKFRAPADEEPVLGDDQGDLRPRHEDRGEPPRPDPVHAPEPRDHEEPGDDLPDDRNPDRREGEDHHAHEEVRVDLEADAREEHAHEDRGHRAHLPAHAGPVLRARDDAPREERLDEGREPEDGEREAHEEARGECDHHRAARGGTVDPSEGPREGVAPEPDEADGEAEENREAREQ